MSQVSALHLHFYYIFLLLLMAPSAYWEVSTKWVLPQFLYCYSFKFPSAQSHNKKSIFQIVLWRNIWTVMYHPSTLLSHADMINPFFWWPNLWETLLCNMIESYLRMRSLDQCSRMERLKYCLKMVFCCYQVHWVYWVPTITTGWSLTKTGTSIHSNEQLHLLLNSSLHYKKLHVVPTCYGLIPLTCCVQQFKLRPLEWIVHSAEAKLQLQESV